MALDNRKTKSELKDIIDNNRDSLPEGSLDELAEKEKEKAINEDSPEPTNTEDLIDDDNPTDDGEEDYEDDTVEDKESDDEDMENEDQPEDTDTEEKPTVKPEQPTAEELYKESSREATTLYFRNKKITDIIEKASDMPEPTESEMKDYVNKMGEDYDNLDAFAKNLLKETMMTRRWQSMVNDVVKEDKKLDEWMGKVDEFISDEKTLNKYPSLSNAEVDFKKFASKPNRRGLDMDDLVGLFLYQKGNQKPPRKKKREMLLQGGNGRNQPPKRVGLNEDDAIALRKRSPKAYMDAVRKGKIKIK